MASLHHVFILLLHSQYLQVSQSRCANITECGQLSYKTET